MAIFNESYVNTLIEATTSNPFKFAGSNIDIDDDDSCLGDKKLITAVNKAWPEIKKEINNFVKSLIKEWYYDSGKDTYKHGANTADKVMKFATLDAISIHDFSNRYEVVVWYNNNRSSEKFFDGHSMHVGFEVSKDTYKVSEIECGL